MPGFCERCGAFALQVSGQRCIVDALAVEFRDDCFRRFCTTLIDRQDIFYFTVLGKGEQCLLGNGIDRTRCSECFKIKRVRCCGILGAGAGPQQALGLSTGAGQFLPTRSSQQFAVGFIGAHRDGDAEAVAQIFRDFILYGYVPAADEE